jgi:hypothetical protein
MVIFPTGSVRLLYWCTVVPILVVFCASCTEHCATIVALLWVVLTPINYPKLKILHINYSNSFEIYLNFNHFFILQYSDTNYPASAVLVYLL